MFRGAIKQAQGPLPKRLTLEDETIYPGDEIQIGTSGHYWLECKREVPFLDGDYSINWKVFLDNSPPSVGIIDLGKLIMDARENHRR